jgi:hypothetical protein
MDGCRFFCPKVRKWAVKSPLNIRRRIFAVEELKDITKIKVNRKLQGEERVQDYEKRIGSLDHFMVGGVEVRCIYTDDGPSLNDRLKELIRTR